MCHSETTGSRLLLQMRQERQRSRILARYLRARCPANFEVSNVVLLTRFNGYKHEAQPLIVSRLCFFLATCCGPC